ncbi:MAG TPA: sensor histidine kinase [Planktothrix sp.]|jgi:signal transduction histidine kinase
MEEIFRKLRIVEWLVLALSAVCQAAWIEHAEAMDANYKLSFLFILIAFICSFYVPRERETRKGLAMLVLQAVLYAGATATGAWKLFGLLFILLTFRVALFVDRQFTAVAVVLIYILHVSAEVVSMHLYAAGYHQHFQRIDQQPIVLVESQLFGFATLVIAALLARTFIAERSARRQAQVLTKEVEEMAGAVERGRIARDIHDTLGHSLTALSVQLEVTEKFLQSGDLSSTEQSLRESRQLASSAMKDVRKSVQTIQADDFRLDEAVGAIAERLRNQKQMDIAIDIDESALSLASRHNILLLVKECLTNVQKHAEASQVEIKLAQNGPTAQLMINDNGKGFRINEEIDGFGIKGMRERVLALGGSFAIESSPGDGTRIRISMPT